MGQDISRPRNRAEFPNVLLFVHLIRRDDAVAELVVEIDLGWNDGIGPNRARRSRRTRICGRDVIAVLDPVIVPVKDGLGSPYSRPASAAVTVNGAGLTVSLPSFEV